MCAPQAVILPCLRLELTDIILLIGCANILLYIHMLCATPLFRTVCRASICSNMLTLCYFLIDVIDLWNGAPFIYLGMNSILMYVGHELLSNYFPFTFNAPETHMGQLAQNLLGASTWLVIAYYCYEIKFFIAI